MMSGERTGYFQENAASCNRSPLRRSSGSYLATEEVAVYLGIDPTADSLQWAILMGFMGLAYLPKARSTGKLAIIGRGTATIGDPQRADGIAGDAE